MLVDVKKEVIKQSIINTTRIISKKANIPIIQEGISPGVLIENGKFSKIIIPCLLNDFSVEELNAIHGYIDHECGHILFSNIDDIIACKKVSRLKSYINNIVDDVLVNKKMAELYPGSKLNIENAYYFINKDYSSEHFKEDNFISNLCLYVGYLIGRKCDLEVIEKFNLEDKLNKIYINFDEKYKELIRNIQTPEDVLEVTNYIYSLIPEQQRREAESQEGEKSSEKSSGNACEKNCEEGGSETDSANNDKPTNAKKSLKGQESPYELADFEDILAQKIVEDIVYNKKYSPISERGEYYSDTLNNFVTSDTLNKSQNSNSVKEFLEKTDTISLSIKKHFERVLSAKVRSFYIGGFTSGKLNSKALFKATLGAEDIFKKKTKIKMKSAACTLLIDYSGSMRGQKTAIATQAAYCFADLLNKFNIPFKILAFTNTPREPIKNVEVGNFVNLDTTNNFIIIKDFNEKFSLKTKKLLTLSYQGKLFTQYNNEDSVYVDYCIKELSLRTEERKNLFVFSDGQPASSYRTDENSANNLKYVVENALTRYGVSVYGIGIQSDSVKEFYNNYIILNKLDDLIKNFVSLVQNAIIKV